MRRPLLLAFGPVAGGALCRAWGQVPGSPSSPAATLPRVVPPRGRFRSGRPIRATRRQRQAHSRNPAWRHPQPIHPGRQHSHRHPRNDRQVGRWNPERRQHQPTVGRCGQARQQPANWNHVTEQPAADGGRRATYLSGVYQEMERLNKEAPRVMWRHQWARVAVIVAGAVTPVLAAWSAVPRPALALTGAIAVAVGATAEVFQFQTHAVTMLHTHNALERELTRYLFQGEPYTGPDRFALFVDRIERIRENANAASRDAWQRSGAPVSPEPPVTGQPGRPG